MEFSRSGHLEIWGAHADGSSPHQITQDGEDAENPTQTRDGRWIVYACGHHAHPGIWKLHPDGSGAQLLVPGGGLSLPDVSPDGLYALYRSGVPGSVIHVVRVEDGADMGFSVAVTTLKKVSNTGRARWMPDGKRIIFTDSDAQGRLGVYAQDFVPGKDTTATRRPLAGFDGDWPSESLGPSPDGKRLVLSESTRELTIFMADGIQGLQPLHKGQK